MGRLGNVDPSSYSQPDLITTEHSVLNWKVDFGATKLQGSVLHRFKVLTANLDKIVSIIKLYIKEICEKIVLERIRSEEKVETLHRKKLIHIFTM